MHEINRTPTDASYKTQAAIEPNANSFVSLLIAINRICLRAALPMMMANSAVYSQDPGSVSTEKATGESRSVSFLEISEFDCFVCARNAIVFRNQAILIGTVILRITIPGLVNAAYGSAAYYYVVVPFCRLALQYAGYGELLLRVSRTQQGPQLLRVILALCRTLPGVL